MIRLTMPFSSPPVSKRIGSLAAVLALQEQGLPHARCVILIEACEESGSYDLPAYVDHLAERIGQSVDVR